MIRRPPRATRTDTLFPYTTLFRSIGRQHIMTLRMKSDVTMQERLKDFDPDGALRQHAREIFELLKEDIHHLPSTFWNNVLERSGLKYRMSPTQIDEAIQRSQEYVRAKYSDRKSTRLNSSH